MYNFEALKDNLIDLVAEQQLKLGYLKEYIAFYYPVKSVMNLLGLEDISLLEDAFDDFVKTTKRQFGVTTFHIKEDRVCIRVAPEASEYVHGMLENDGSKKYVFLCEFLKDMMQHGKTIQDFVALFEKYSAHVVVKKMREEEFDYLLFFGDKYPDAYRYCIKFEGEHTTYHRFTEYDFGKFNFDVMD